ncbi:hypothetical protein [Streptomyces sp. NPDC101132]|uniref:hypothetical protein n=1 Tax=Streptomyces sp. NPDC101132 TaxID=3366110 RepID=UPI003822144F
MSKHARHRTRTRRPARLGRRLPLVAAGAALAGLAAWLCGVPFDLGGDLGSAKGSQELRGDGAHADGDHPSRGEHRPAAPHAGPPAPARPKVIPGLSDATRARIPADSRQVVLVSGKGKDSSYNTVTLYARAEGSRDWTAGPSWQGRNGAKGWSTDRRYGDLTSPIGVFALTDAGGLLSAPPGTRLPYDQDEAFVPGGVGVEGESLAGSFDYVVAIDFNRRPGTSPLDPEKPEGEEKGGNIWLHVDHDGPSQGCVGIPEAAMRKVLETLDPAQHPVIVMGPAGM